MSPSLASSFWAKILANFVLFILTSLCLLYTMDAETHLAPLEAIDLPGLCDSLSPLHEAEEFYIITTSTAGHCHIVSQFACWHKCLTASRPL